MLGSYGAGYVTCTVEVGLSESFKQLVVDANIWLESDDSHVSQVITAILCEDI
jgi:hypothetical protein